MTLRLKYTVRGEQELTRTNVQLGLRTTYTYERRDNGRKADVLITVIYARVLLYKAADEIGP